MSLMNKSFLLKVYKPIKSYKLYFCMIRQVTNLIKIKISDNCFNFNGDRSLSRILLSCFWVLPHGSTVLKVIEDFPYLFVF